MYTGNFFIALYVPQQLQPSEVKYLVSVGILGDF